MGEHLPSQGRLAPLEIHLFGGFQVLYRGESLPPVPSRQARLLFAYLVMHAGRPLPRGPLAARFWPDQPEARARRRLSHTIWQIQDVLNEVVPGRTYLVTDSEHVRFDTAEPYWLDVEVFEEALDVVDAADRDDVVIGDQLRHAVDLYRGDFLAGHYEDWVTAEQDRLAHRYLTAVGRLARFCERQGNFEQALTYAKRITHEAPLREDVHRDVMRLQVLLNRPSEALQQFERCRSVLAEELGAEPAAETVELYERVARTRQIATPPPIDEPDLTGRRLVGRRDERERLLVRVDRALQGRSSFVLVEGEPGVGKSRLIGQIAEDARWRGLTVLWGGCAPTTGGVPYQAIRDAVTPELHAVRAAQLAPHLEPVWRQAAAQLFPALVGRRDGTGVAALAGADAEDRLRHGVVQVILALARLSPTLLVIEDAHWADLETLALLRALAAADAQVPLVVVLTFRDMEARDTGDVWEALRAIDRVARPDRIRLDRLSAFETAELVSETLATVDPPIEFVHAIHRESGGNPLYALELLRAIRDSGDLPGRTHATLRATTVPAAADLHHVVAGRLDRLDPAERGLLDIAAVLGDEFALELLADCLPADAGRTSAATLERLLRRNVLEHDGVVARFTHAVTQRVVQDAIPAARRRELHAVAADAVTRHDPDDVERLAVHLVGAGDARRAVPVLRRAATRALDVHAYATAARHLTEARELASTALFAVGDLVDLLVAHEDVLTVLGRQDDRADVLEELEHLAGGDDELQLRVRRRRARQLADVGDLAGAEQVARAGVELADRTGSAELGPLLSTLGQVLGYQGRNVEAVDVLTRAVDVAADPALEAEAAAALGTALRFLQRFDQAREEVGRALDAARSCGDAAAEVRALGALADVAAEAGDLDAALAGYDEALRTAGEIGYRHREGVTLVNLANLEQLHGRPVGAATHYDRAATLFAELGNPRGQAMVQLNRAWLRHRWLGEDAGAAEDARAAQQYFLSVGNVASAAVCAQTVASIHTRAGDTATASALLDVAWRDTQAAGEQRAAVQVLRGMAENELANGDTAAAARIADQGLDLAERVGTQDFVAEVAALAAVAHARAGRPRRAREAAALAGAAIDVASEQHLVHHRLAEVARAVGDDASARDHDRLARELLDRGLADLTERRRERAIDAIPEFAAIVGSWGGPTGRDVDVRLTRADVPSGRPVTDRDLQVVRLHVPPATDPDLRGAALVTVLDQVAAQRAAATVRDLADLFGVSTSTIRRDLKRLRDAGFDVTTRGSA